MFKVTKQPAANHAQYYRCCTRVLLMYALPSLRIFTQNDYVSFNIIYDLNSSYAIGIISRMNNTLE